jgi:hypothetical protein
MCARMQYVCERACVCGECASACLRVRVAVRARHWQVLFPTPINACPDPAHIELMGLRILVLVKGWELPPHSPVA